MGKSREQKVRDLLDHLFKDIHSPASFTSPEPLFREAKKRMRGITRREVNDYLASQDVYTLHRRAVRKYRRLPTLAAGLHTEWQGDLAIFDKLARQNRGFKYLLVCIDTLSRQIFVEPVRSKHSANMIDAFERLFNRAGVVPWKLMTDQGLEFTAKRVQEYFHSKELQHFPMFTSPKFHAGMAERANRSIKERLYRYFTERRTHRWIDVIQDIVNGINNSPNSSIGMRPVDVTFANAEKLRARLREEAESKHQPKRWRTRRFRVGDRVRVEKGKQVFQKGYMPNFTGELFTVERVRCVPYQPPTYRIKNDAGEVVKGWFYASDLCRVAEPRKSAKRWEHLYDIERVMEKQKRDGIEYCLVKWKGYGSEHNSWIPASTITWKQSRA